MSDQAEAATGALETPKDAGEGLPGIVKRWMMEIDLSSKTEKFWREQAHDVAARYRDEKNDMEGNTTTVGRYKSGDRYNILYSNIQTIVPALYNQTPKPDVRRRYRDKDEVGKTISDVMERALSYISDEHQYDRFMRMAVKDCQLAGRGVTRIRYVPVLSEDGESMQDEYVEFEHVNWSDFRRGPGRTWEECQWIAFRHTFDVDELKTNFPDTWEGIELDYTPRGMGEKDGDEVADTFKRAVVWEIWDKKKRQVVFVAPSMKERPAKQVEDPLNLKEFYPIPRPLYAADYTDSLVPVEPFRYYKDQADELDTLTRRITDIVDACKIRGVYDSTMGELATLMDSRETQLIPAEDILPLMQAGGLEKAIWIWPFDKIAAVLVHLYTQREAVKTVIYEITGIADIMRGSSAASETYGAQQLKAQFGTMRLDDMRQEVQRYARDVLRIAAEIVAEHFSPETMSIMTEVSLPTMEAKALAAQQAMRLQATEQPVPKQLQEVLESPTWEECLQILRDDQQRCYRIDIETDSTIAGDQAQEQKNITELITGISSFIQQAGPAVEQGYLPIEAAKSILMTAVRKFKMGREVEDALDMIGEGDEEQQQDPMVMQLQTQLQELQQEHQTMAQENEQLKSDKSAEVQRTQMESQKAQSDAAFKDRELALKEFEASKPAPDETVKIQAEMQMERERMAFEAEQKALDRQADIAKAIISKSDTEMNEDDANGEAAVMLKAVTAALTAPKVVIRDEFGNVVGSETVMGVDNG